MPSNPFTVTKKDFAKRLGTNVNNLNQILLAWKAKGFPKPDSKHVKRVGLANMYTENYYNLVKKAAGGSIGARGARNTPLKRQKQAATLRKPLTGSSTIPVKVSVSKALLNAYNKAYLEQRVQALVNAAIGPILKKLEATIEG